MSKKELVRLLEFEDQHAVLYYVLERLRGETELGDLFFTADYVYFDTGHPIVLMAHADTVSIRECKVVAERNVLRNEHATEPLGADDRAGVYAALTAYARIKAQGKPLPSLLFTTDEECGGLGVRKFIKDNCFNNDAHRLVLALDRKGASEYVTYKTQPQQVEQYVESFGFTKAFGSYNDVLDLNCAYKIPGVNLSVGYYGQHTGSEKLHLDELQLTINRIIQMVNDPITERYAVKDTYNWRAQRGQGHWQNRFQYGGKYQGGNAEGGSGSGGAGSFDEYYEGFRGAGIGSSGKSSEGISRGKDDKDGKLRDAFKEIDEFFDLNFYLSGAYPHSSTAYQCAQCNRTWYDCVCGSVCALAREELDTETREALLDVWLVASDGIYEQFSKELLEDIIDEVEETEAEAGEEEELSAEGQCSDEEPTTRALSLVRH